MHNLKQNLTLRAIGVGLAMLYAHHVKAEKYGAPIDVLEAARAAISAKDDERIVACLTPDSFGMFAATGVMEATSTRNTLLKRGDVEGINLIDDAFRKHHLSHDACEKSLRQVGNASPLDQATLIVAWLKQIDHKPQFIADLDLVCMQIDSAAGTPRMASMINTLIYSSPIQGDLVELKVGDATATAIIRRTIRGEDRLCTLRFQKLDGGWLIHLANDFRFTTEALNREKFDSPEQAYTYCYAELCTRNYREFAACLTEQSLHRATTSLVHKIYDGKRVRMEQRRGDDIALLSVESGYALFDAALRYHGISNESLAALTENELEEADVASILDAVADKPALFADLCELPIKSAGVDLANIQSLLTKLLSAELGNMQRGVDEHNCEWAKGTIKATVEGKNGLLPMMFEKHECGWLVYLPL